MSSGWLAGLVPGCQAVLDDNCVEGAAELADAFLGVVGVRPEYGGRPSKPERAVEVKNTCNTRAEISYLNCG